MKVTTRQLNAAIIALENSQINRGDGASLYVFVIDALATALRYKMTNIEVPFREGEAVRELAAVRLAFERERSERG